MSVSRSNTQGDNSQDRHQLEYKVYKKTSERTGKWSMMRNNLKHDSVPKKPLESLMSPLRILTVPVVDLVLAESDSLQVSCVNVSGSIE